MWRGVRKLTISHTGKVLKQNGEQLQVCEVVKQNGYNYIGGGGSSSPWVHVKCKVAKQNGYSYKCLSL